MINHIIITAGPSVCDPADVSGIKTIDDDGTVHHFATAKLPIGMWTKSYWSLAYRRFLVRAVRRSMGACQ